MLLLDREHWLADRTPTRSKLRWTERWGAFLRCSNFVFSWTFQLVTIYLICQYLWTFPVKCSSIWTKKKCKNNRISSPPTEALRPNNCCSQQVASIQNSGENQSINFLLTEMKRKSLILICLIIWYKYKLTITSEPRNYRPIIHEELKSRGRRPRLLRGAWRDHCLPEPFSLFLHETGLESLKITSARCFLLKCQRKAS